MTKPEERAKEIIPDDSDQFFKNQKIDWNGIRYQVAQALREAERRGMEEAAKICEDFIKKYGDRYHVSMKCIENIRFIAQAIRKAGRKNDS